MLIHNKCSKNKKNCLLLEKSLERQIFAVKCLNTAKKEANIWLRVEGKHLSRDVEDKKDHVNREKSFCSQDLQSKQKSIFCEKKTRN